MHIINEESFIIIMTCPFSCEKIVLQSAHTLSDGGRGLAQGTGGSMVDDPRGRR